MSETYVSPFSTRYASAEMQKLFSPLHKASLWRELWIILAEAEQEEGLAITDGQLAEMRATKNDIDLDACAAYEKETRHDVMAHIRAWGDQCPNARGIIHLGATSCYVGDNADILILRDAMRLIRLRAAAVLRALRAFADKYAAVPCLAFTHYQPAQPVTVTNRSPSFAASRIGMTSKPSMYASMALTGSTSVTITFAPKPFARIATPLPHQP